MSTRKSAIDKAIEALEADKRAIDLAIAHLRATAHEKKPAPRVRRMAPLGITGQASVFEGATK